MVLAEPVAACTVPGRQRAITSYADPLAGCGLMALMFFSSRSSHDEAATPKFMQRRDEDE